MKSKYQAPTVEVIEFGNNDFLTSSAEYDLCNPGHGHGHGHGNGHGNAWGYDNGNHNGHGNGHNPHDNP